MNKKFDHLFIEELEKLKILNSQFSKNIPINNTSLLKDRIHKLKKVLIANRGEIAKRFFLALHEEDIPSVAVITDADRGQSWYEFADEVIYIGDNLNYTNVPAIIGATFLSGANAIYPGYGFISESAEFVKSIKYFSKKNNYEIIFMGPSSDTMELVGDKINARKIAKENGIPLFESSEVYKNENFDIILSNVINDADRIGYPVILKLTAGGGGKGMEVVSNDTNLKESIKSIIRIGEKLYNNSTFYLEKFIEDPIHMEVQIFNDLVISLRKCAVQRRNQKIIEESGHSFFDKDVSNSLLEFSKKMSQISGYFAGGGAGTVEFLIDNASGEIGFLEMNSRLQVEYAVTEQSLGIDIAKWQILFFDGRANDFVISDKLKRDFSELDHSIECRIYAEDPEDNYMPSPGVITEIDLPTFNGIRCDFGFGEGDSILSMYDPMIGKIIANGITRRETIIRLERALQEFYIKGIKTNIGELLKIIRSKEFIKGEYTNNILRQINNNEELILKNKSINHIIFGAISEYIQLLQEMVKQYIIAVDLEKSFEIHQISKLPFKYILTHFDKEYIVEFVQTSIYSCYVFVDSIFNGEILIKSFNERSDDLFIVYNNKPLRVRVDRFHDSIVLKMKDDYNKINYYKIEIIHREDEDDTNIIDVKSPFQGTFISFCKNNIEIGDIIEQDQPLIILSSMKMETTINSPISGELCYILKDKTANESLSSSIIDEKYLGKSIQENEILFKIKKFSTNNKVDLPFNNSIDNNSILDKKNDNLLDLIYHGKYKNLFKKNPEKGFEIYLNILKGYLLGFVHLPQITEKISNFFNSFSFEELSLLLTPEIEKSINTIIQHFTNIKKLFLSDIVNNYTSYYEEITFYLSNSNNSNVEISDNLQSMIDFFYRTYRFSLKKNELNKKSEQIQYMFFILNLSIKICIKNSEIIKYMVEIISYSKNTSSSTMKVLNELLQQEQSEIDDSFYKTIKSIITDKLSHNKFLFHNNFMGNEFVNNSDQKNIPYHNNILYNDYITQLSSSIKDKDIDLYSDINSNWILEKIKYKISLLKKNNYTIKRKLSPNSNIIFLNLEKENKFSFVVFIFLDETKLKNLNEEIIKTTTIFSIFQNNSIYSNNWLEIIPKNETFIFISDSKEFITYENLQDIFLQTISYINKKLFSYIILDINVKNCDLSSIVRRKIKITQKNNIPFFDFINDDDLNNNYRSKISIKQNQALYNNNKWPMDKWVELCFSNNSHEEIKIKSIDNSKTTNDNSNVPDLNPVGSKIFYGIVNGQNACFYFKDSRVSGGATGNREGLKYVAATYISYFKNWPLFIWNDSAGANIREGIISLNRGAEGFMMNSLVSKNVDHDKFLNYINNVADPVLENLFNELDKQFNFNRNSITKKRTALKLISCGIGPSAGLDVYGASQATIQILLDSEQSYRVLTGSNIVKTVTGEDISNYEIGGAKILGKWTGIADFIAEDKVHFITIINKLQSLFADYKDDVQKIDHRKPDTSIEEILHESTVVTEKIIRRNVDNNNLFHFKKNYNDTNSLISGFSKLQGKRVLILGVKTNTGLSSSASIIKTKELLNIASHTESNQILIFGKNWISFRNYNKNKSLRNHYDLINNYSKRTGYRIHMITHIEGLNSIEINSFADIIIFIRSNKDDSADLKRAESNSTFIVKSFEEAFSIISHFLKLVYSNNISTKVKLPVATPSIPENKSTPYDIIESVINPVFDEKSFLEMYSETNDINSGPNLITGLALLNGDCIGIIADQPLIKGGGADAMGTEKFRVFTEFLNNKNIPLVMFSNSSGFIPGSKEERFRIQAIGAESLNANILGEIPVVSLILNQNFGGRIIHAFNKFLRPGIIYLALESATMAVIGVDAAFNLLHGKKIKKLQNNGSFDEISNLKEIFYKEYLDKAKATNDATITNVLDWTIPDINNLREHIIKGMKLAKKKCRESFRKE